VNGDGAYQSLNPNGANRTVNLPAVGVDNHPYLLINSATATYTINILSGSVSVCVLQPGDALILLSNGSTWYVMGSEWKSPRETWTYVSASSFRVTGDRRTTYTKGTKLWWTQSGTSRWGVIVSSSYSSPNTTVNIFVNTDYVVANATISANFYSNLEKPVGYPDQFNFSPSWTNLTVGNGAVDAKVALTPTTCKGYITLKWAAAAATTSISGAVSIAPPVTALDYGNPYVPIGACGLIDWGTSLYMGSAVLNSTTAIEVRAINAAGTYAVWSSISSTVPFTWGVNDLLTIDFEFMW
jgi:hypothetical protein